MQGETANVTYWSEAWSTSVYRVPHVPYKLPPSKQKEPQVVDCTAHGCIAAQHALPGTPWRCGLNRRSPTWPC
jgi:hypothetical protein